MHIHLILDIQQNLGIVRLRRDYVPEKNVNIKQAMLRVPRWTRANADARGRIYAPSLQGGSSLGG